jgi:hypothetical protein
MTHAAGTRAVSGLLPWAGLAVALLLFLMFGDVPERTLFWDALFDAGHIPLFGLLSLAALRIIRGRFPRLSPGRAWGAAVAVVLLLGAATELLQLMQPGRESSLADLAFDMGGAGGCLLAAARFPGMAGGPTWTRTPRSRRLALAGAAVLLLAAGAPLVGTMSALAAREASMPTLFPLEGAWWEGRFVRLGEASMITPGARPAQLPRDFTEPLARLDLKPAAYPGLALDEPSPDWRRYARLSFTVVSDLAAPARLVIRIHDARHDQRYEDRFNRVLIIRPGINRVVIPLDEVRHAPVDREMDMSRIRGIVIFAYRPGAPLRFYLSPLRLE